jgi:GTPase SAR1 family protein
MYAYYAFALRINSELVFPELLACPPSDLSDVTIKWGQVNSSGLELPNSSKGLFYQASETALWLHIPNVARFLISHGNQIVIDPIGGVDEDSLRVFILGSCMGALLMQRDLFLLHGNAIKMGEHCISFVGASGAGKSTLSGAFFKRGYSILADDVCAVNSAGQVIPSFPQIKLWFDAAKHLNIDTQSLRKIRPKIEKFAVPLAQQFQPDALPLKAVYVLHSHNKDEFLLTPISGMQKLQPLRAHTFRKNYIHGLNKDRDHFTQCTQIAGLIDIVRITRPNDGYKLDALVNLIEQDLTVRGFHHVC